MIPQLSAILGPCAGGAVYSPALTDFVFMVENTSYLHITGPDVVKAVTHESVTSEELGGSRVHAEKSGVAHFVAHDDRECLTQLRELFAYLPLNNVEDPPVVKTDDDPLRRDPELDAVVPAEPNKPYDMKDVVKRVVDDRKFLEVQRDHAKNIIIGFARLGGRSVGIVANQPAHLAGVPRHRRVGEGARFVRFCDAFNIPIITFEDVPGFLPGTAQEYGGIIRHGAKLLYAYCEATVPKLTVITPQGLRRRLRRHGEQAHPRRSQSGVALRRDRGHGGGGGGEDHLSARDPGAEDSKAEEARKIADYREKFAHPYHAAARGYVDDVIEPNETRPRLVAALEVLKTKRERNPPRKHGNIPL